MRGFLSFIMISRHLQLLLLMLSSISVRLNPTVFALSSDGEILLSVKAHIEDQNNSLSNWLSSDPTPCMWTGIICDHNDSVISLKLSGMNLTGTLSADIGCLKSIVSISIELNNFCGTLPPSLSNLSELRFLNISHNNFSNLFPANLSSLRLLQALDAYNNNFSGELPADLGRLKHLQHLHLGGNYFQGSIPPGYGELTRLKYLGLSGNVLSGEIPPEIGNLSRLEYLYLGYFNGYRGGIPWELGKLQSLIRLDLSFCGLSGSIPPSLGNLTNLDSLFLQINSLTGNIPSELGKLHTLKSLDVSNNQLEGVLPKELKGLQKLELASFFRNKIHGEIPSVFADLPKLQVLFLWGNNLSGSIPQKLGLKSKLQNLDLSSNQLNGTIPPCLCKGGELQDLVLFDNALVGGIPPSFGNCQSLLRVRVGNNRLSGQIPHGLFGLSNIQMLQFVGNNFSGQLPETFAAPQLEILDISDNYLNGRVSEGISDLTMLSMLLISGNRLSGGITHNIGNLRKLFKLDLSNNAFSGSIPVEISRCERLSSLDLSQNKLIGNIPFQIEELQVLDFLNLSHNHLTGSIPSQLQFLPSLTTVDFSYNKLSGQIPRHGQFGYFNASSFIGNSGLCGGQLSPCIPAAPPVSPDYHRKVKHPASLWIWLVGGLFSAALLILIVGIFCLFKNHQTCICGLFEEKRAIKPWKLTAFQKLDFHADHVLDCLTEENIVGRGGSGIVYKGVMPTGEIVAVKRLSTQGKKGVSDDHGFSAEIQTLGKIRHRHIVKLLGCCSNQETNLLLYEYMPKGSLGELLHGKQGSLLDWKKRYNISVQAASGLCYLHHDCSPIIVHRDVKSNNILLDSNFGAHVADFGLAKFFQSSDRSQSMSSIAGSYGYIAPEYAYTLKVNEKSDIFSFGVVLLELVTGRRPIESEFGDGVDLVQWVRKKVQTRDGVLDVLDSRISGDHVPLHEVMVVLRVALLCSDSIPVERPTMRDVVQMLCDLKSKPDNKTFELFSDSARS